MMEATSTSETSVKFCQTTRCYNLTDCHCLENLKSYLMKFGFGFCSESHGTDLGVCESAAVFSDYFAESWGSMK
jgi:hypothetical protein